jgi:hypothetical protein
MPRTDATITTPPGGRPTVESVGRTGELTRIRIEHYRGQRDPGWARWPAEFHRADDAHHNRRARNTD